MTKKTVLDNGLTIMTAPRDNSDLVLIKYIVHAGSFFENDDERGISHAAEHMLFKGTHKYDAKGINEAIAMIGGSTNAYTGRDITAFYIISPVKEWKKNMDILSDMIWNNTIPAEEWKKEKTVIIEEIKMYEDAANMLVYDNLEKVMFKDYPNRGPIAGTIESVSAFTADDIRKYIDKWYTPQNICLSVVGNISNDDIVKYAKSITPDVSNNNYKYTSNFKSVPFDLQSMTVKRDIQQAHMACGISVGKPDTEDMPVAEMISHIMGDGFTSRLFKLIREDRGLVYHVDCELDNDDTDSMILTCYAGLDESNIDTVKNIIIDEFVKLTKEKVSENELKMMRNMITTKGGLSEERISTASSELTDAFIYGRDYTVKEYSEKVCATTADDIMRVAKKFFTKNNFCFSYVVPNGKGGKDGEN